MYHFEKATYFEVTTTPRFAGAPDMNLARSATGGRGRSEPSNDQLQRGAGSSGELPNPQSYQGQNYSAPAPGEFSPQPYRAAAAVRPTPARPAAAARSAAQQPQQYQPPQGGQQSAAAPVSTSPRRVVSSRSSTASRVSSRSRASTAPSVLRADRVPAVRAGSEGLSSGRRSSARADR